MKYNLLYNDNQVIIDLMSKNASRQTIDTVLRLQNERRQLERGLNANVKNRRVKVHKRIATKAQNTETHHTRNQRKKRSDLVIALEHYLSEARYTRKQIIDMCMYRFDCAVSTVKTYLTDSKNAKYNVFSQLVCEDSKTKIMHFVNVQAKSIDSIQRMHNQEMIDSFQLA